MQGHATVNRTGLPAAFRVAVVLDVTLSEAKGLAMFAR
jgi:hypothetical protein